MNAPAGEWRDAVEHPTVLGAVIRDIVDQIARRVVNYPRVNTRLCGACGCLCRLDESCPECIRALGVPADRLATSVDLIRGDVRVLTQWPLA